jgi:hypothetical protein
MSCTNIPFNCPGSAKNTEESSTPTAVHTPPTGSRIKTTSFFLVRPDGYVGLIASQNWMNSVIEYQKAVECVQHDSVKLRMDTQ